MKLLNKSILFGLSFILAACNSSGGGNSSQKDNAVVINPVQDEQQDGMNSSTENNTSHNKSSKEDKQSVENKQEKKEPLFEPSKAEGEVFNFVGTSTHSVLWISCEEYVFDRNTINISHTGEGCLFFDLSDSDAQLCELEDLLVKNGISVPMTASMEEIVENSDEDPELLYTIIAEWCMPHLESPRERKAFTSELLCFAETYGGASSFRLIFQELCC